MVRTDGEGIAWFDVPGDLPIGEYRVRAVVLGDGTAAEGMIAIWPRGAEAVITDVDGTLTPTGEPPRTCYSTTTRKCTALRHTRSAGNGVVSVTAPTS
jgi:hypothetical protein